MLTVQKISSYGTSTPAVARTALQGADILNYFACSKEQKDEAFAVLFELQRHLVKCVEIRDQLSNEIDLARSEFTERLPAKGFAVTIPGIGDLQSRAESYLQSAKLAVACAGNLFEPFYGVAHGHKFNKVSVWAEKTFGVADDFTIVLKSWEPFVRSVVKLRNCVDHPKTESGAPLVVVNFKLSMSGSTPQLLPPVWGLTGSGLRPILEDFDKIIEQCIRLSENVLLGLFERHRVSSLMVIEEIPVERRDPHNPRRLVVRFRS